MIRPTLLAASVLVLTLAACGGNEVALDPALGFGPNPTLPEPAPQRIPTVNIAEAVGWPAGVAPTPAPGPVSAVGAAVLRAFL